MTKNLDYDLYVNNNPLLDSVTYTIDEHCAVLSESVVKTSFITDQL